MDESFAEPPPAELAERVFPFPSPEVLKQYEENHPKLGIAKSILEMVKEEVNHRRQLEIDKLSVEKEGSIRKFEAAREDQRAERMERRIGQFLGFGIGVVTIVTGGVVAALGAQWPGGSDRHRWRDWSGCRLRHWKKD